MKADYLQSPKQFLNRPWRDIVNTVVEIPTAEFAKKCIEYEQKHRNREALIVRLVHRMSRCMRMSMLGEHRASRR